MKIVWEAHPAISGLWRFAHNGVTYAAIHRQDDYAMIAVRTARGGERIARVTGDSLDDNKRTARDILRSEGFTILD